MIPYNSNSGKRSGVTAYETGVDFIIVRFNDKTYRYTERSAGRKAINTMKKLAAASRGLSTYIAQNEPGFE